MWDLFKFLKCQSVIQDILKFYGGQIIDHVGLNLVTPSWMRPLNMVIKSLFSFM